ncbi:protein kinase [Streptomyces sp. RKCA744]|uniref:protein kinase domain-containing protein n=1 Tax=Streptomyces sp. RKCA744 TaxID=2959340 RepID=UPI00209D0CA6|nr:protein kinase [Streptomyces sp. RKCA744]MCO8308831.1 protein kinase [Streptomyces sp. RKCA744]
MQATVLDGRYQLIDPIGTGGFGQVWKAHGPKVDRVVAVKVLTGAGGLEGSRQVARFAREAAVAGSLSTHASSPSTTSDAYMAPECFSGTFDHRSDLYSPGCVLYEMTTGQRPFDGTSWHLIHQHLNEQPPALRSLRPNAPPELDTPHPSWTTS